MTQQDTQRARRVALALLVRRHLIECRDDIRQAHAELEPTRRAGPGVKVSTALAELIGLPPYANPGKAKPEPAKHLIDFLQGAGPNHYDAIFTYFRDRVITPAYRSAAPAYIQMAIHEVFDGAEATTAANPQTAGQVNPVLAMAARQARYSPAAIIAGIEETLPQLNARARSFEGTWAVIRYAHHGKRVVRLGLEVSCPPTGRPIFKVYFRTRGMTVNRSTAKYVTQGSLIVLKGGQHVMMFGQEEARDEQGEPDGYPVTIICPGRISRDAPFIGIGQRRHDDGKVFAVKAQFILMKGQSIDDLLAADKIGSFESPAEIAAMASDIPGFDALLAQLMRTGDDIRSGLVL